MREYLPAKAFSERVGISVQAVYKGAKTGRLKEYAKTINGRIMISSDAMKLYDENNSDEQTFNDEVFFLREQIRLKDDQIRELQESERAWRLLCAAREQRLMQIEQQFTQPKQEETQQETKQNQTSVDCRMNTVDDVPSQEQKSSGLKGFFKRLFS